MSTHTPPTVIEIHESTLVLDGATIPEPHPELHIQDSTVDIRNWAGLVHAGIGAVLHAHTGVTYTAETGAVVYHHPGATADHVPPGALESGAITIVQVP